MTHEEDTSPSGAPQCHGHSLCHLCAQSLVHPMHKAALDYECCLSLKELFSWKECAFLHPKHPHSPIKGGGHMRGHHSQVWEVI